MYELDSRKSRIGYLPLIYGVITGVSIALVVLAGIVFLGGRSNSETRTTAGDSGQEGRIITAGYEPSSIDRSRRNAIVNATEMVAPAVVNVTVIRTQTYRSPVWRWDDLFSRNWPRRTRKVGGYGSGFIIREDGYVITNAHVVNRAERIWITLPSGEDMEASLVGEASNYDIAVLKVNATGLPYVRMGDSDHLLVGEWVIAIGSPFGHLLADPHPTVTVGVVSAFHRDVKPEASSQRILQDLIQTDAAINPGNSGGPLVNSMGEVIGVNTAIFSRSGGSEGIGFAIPINRAGWIVEEILEHGRVRSVYMGMTGVDLTPDIAASLDLDRRTGVLVREIYEDGPAAEAGIRAGDVLVSINGIELRNRDHVNRIVFPARVDDKMTIELDRKGSLKTVELVLRERPEDI
jgi:serine protease Do